MKKAKSEAIELFDSIQLGVGVNGGAEAIIHAPKITYEKILDSDLREGVLQIDFRKAFNLVKRSQLLQAACDFIPGTAAFTNFCYSQHVPLLYNNASLQSVLLYTPVYCIITPVCSTRRSPGSTSRFVDVMACYRKNETRFQILPSTPGNWTMVSLQAPKIKAELRSITLPMKGVCI